MRARTSRRRGPQRVWGCRSRRSGSGRRRRGGAPPPRRSSASRPQPRFASSSPRSPALLRRRPVHPSHRLADSPEWGVPAPATLRRLFPMRPVSVAIAAVPNPPLTTTSESLVESYRRLAEVFHHVLSEQSLDSLLDRIADPLSELVPYEGLSIYEADEARRLLIPVLARDQWAD